MSNKEMTYQEALRAAQQYLAAHDVADAEVDAWLLLGFLTKMDRTRFLLERGQNMSREELDRYRSLVQQRGTHIPLQYLTGEQEFMGLTFQVNPSVLIPRQDTEVLVQEALKRMVPGMRILDLCTGSGCIGISLCCLGSAQGTLHVDLADLSEDALGVAECNTAQLHAGVGLIQGDLFESVTETYDMIVSNPPYIRTAVIEELSPEVRRHEPYMALDGREDGLYFYRRIVRESRDYLREAGWLLFEIGYDQGADVKRLLEENGFTDTEIVRDLAGLDRVVIGRFQEVLHV
jgi:release factor glutamine methyltransferase